MGLATDATGIQFRILNQSKGPAVRGSRAQIDMDRYRLYIRNIILQTDNLDLKQEMVDSLIIKENKVIGVETHLGNRYNASKVIISTGTFLNGIIHIGEKQQQAGRQGEFASVKLGKNLRDLGFEVGRLKTGTCPRIDGKSIDLSVMEKQGGNDIPVPFSFRTDRKKFKPHQLACHVTYTKKQTPNNRRQLFIEHHWFRGQIEGNRVPRYWPSIGRDQNKVRLRGWNRAFIFW